MSYTAPVLETDFLLRCCSSLPDLIRSGACPDLSLELVQAILEQAGKFAADVLGPLNRIADSQGVEFKNGEVRTTSGHREIYRDWAAAGWNAVSASTEWGGMGMPQLLNTACLEYWHSACMAFGLGPLLSMGAAETIEAFGSSGLKDIYLPKLVSGEWMATMNLTEPHAGSDLGALRARAIVQKDGSYRIFGSKIFITYGEHDLTENILHLVLARLPDAPAGSKGISLFLVPKFLVGPDGVLGEMNDVRCTGIEHKLGLHGSPTCTMSFGDGAGAHGWIIGQEGRGLAAMFTMMNRARLAVATQGVAVAEAATQKATAYARERRQGRISSAGDGAMSPIIDLPDVTRMLLTMRALTNAARCLCVKTADALDRSRLLPEVADRLAAQLEADLLTPIAKAFATDIGVEVASLGIQVHGGIGYIEETGVPQFLRDARICTIYEGTNGIQAIDLVTRKLFRGPQPIVAIFIQRFQAISSASAARMPDAIAAASAASNGACGFRKVLMPGRSLQTAFARAPGQGQAAAAHCVPRQRPACGRCSDRQGRRLRHRP